MLLYDSNLGNQHSTIRKFAKRLFGPYIVKKVYDNATYILSELDGTLLQNVMHKKRLQIVKKRYESKPPPNEDDEREDSR